MQEVGAGRGVEGLRAWAVGQACSNWVGREGMPVH